jgi:N-acetylmuramoyl-L-alanine amidase
VLLERVRLRLRYLVAAALAVGFGYVAAPALSTQPYLPEAVDFQQGLPPVEAVGGGPAAARAHGHGHAGEGPVSFRSSVISAPERFDLVGLAGELRPLELRAREAGEDWSRWVEAANGDPVYFGGAEEVQLRARGWRPAGTLHYVNVSGTTSELGGLLTGARTAINSAFVSASRLLDTSAEALPLRPPIVKRGTWGATRAVGGCKPRAGASFGTVKAAAVHHTVTANKYSEAEAPSIVLGICRYHRNANGWNDIGYNALIDRFGNVYAGRVGGVKKAVVGAHAQGFNAQTTGVAAIGTHTSTPITPATKEALVSYLAWKLAVHGLEATGKTTMISAGGSASRYPAGRKVRTNKIIGHGTVGLTACPGTELAAELPKLRRLVQERIDASGGTVPVVPEPEPSDPPPDGGGIAPGVAVGTQPR